MRTTLTDGLEYTVLFAFVEALVVLCFDGCKNMDNPDALTKAQFLALEPSPASSSRSNAAAAAAAAASLGRI